MNIIAIDPGVTGAIASYDTVSKVLAVYDYPVVEVLINKKKRKKVSAILLLNIIRECQNERHDVYAFLESNNGRPAMGGRKLGATTIWSMASAEAMAEMALAAQGITTRLIPPTIWKKSMKVPPDKEAARMIALRLLPSHAHYFSRKKDHNRAEAALLALAGEIHLKSGVADNGQ